jgi:hypothetical protein
LHRIWGAGGTMNKSRTLQRQRYCCVFASYLRRWRYHEYFQNIVNTTILLCFHRIANITMLLLLLCVSIIFEALEVPWIPPEHFKYNDITVFCIVFEALEVPWIPPEHC